MLSTVISIVVGGLFVAFVVSGYVVGWQDRHLPKPPETPLEVDSFSLGLMAGAMGGDVVDAAAMRFALRRFEQKYGRKATARDLGVVAGLARSLR